MNRHMMFLLVITVFLGPALAPGVSAAQSIDDRFELGWRLRRLEDEFEKDKSEKPRKRMLQPMTAAVNSFFGGDFVQAARKLDEAWVKVSRFEDMPEARAVAALRVRIHKRVFTEESFIGVARIINYYETESAIEGGTIRLRFLDDNGNEAYVESMEFSSDDFYFNLDLRDLAEGDYSVEATLETETSTYLIGRNRISFVANFDLRTTAVASKLEKAAGSAPDRDLRSATMTANGYLALSRKLLIGNPTETTFDAARYMKVAQTIADRVEAGEDNWIGKNADGEFLLKLTKRFKDYSQMFDESGHVVPALISDLDVVDRSVRPTVATVRINVPPHEDNERLPVVFAMHGAAGSENLYFDGYGNGRVVELAAERGWILVSPRINPAKGTGLNVDELLIELGCLFPVDYDRVMLVGHSMGALNILSQMDATKTPINAAALIAGGTRIPDSPRFASVPMFVATGQYDFGATGVKQLAESLKEHGYEHEFHDYEWTEHMAIMQIAMDDVFAFFDGNIAGK